MFPHPFTQFFACLCLFFVNSEWIDAEHLLNLPHDFIYVFLTDRIFYFKLYLYKYTTLLIVHKKAHFIFIKHTFKLQLKVLSAHRLFFELQSGKSLIYCVFNSLDGTSPSLNYFWFLFSTGAYHFH